MTKPDFWTVPDFYSITESGKEIGASLHFKSESGPAAISIAVGDGHTEISTADARELGELLVFSADAIEGARL